MSASVQRVLDTDRPRVVLVADGMGGENSGEIASRLVGERLAMRLKEITLGQSSIVDMLRKTNRDVFDAMSLTK